MSEAQIDNRMLSDQVGALLVRDIVTGRLKQGSRVNEAELSRNLGISRNPIREAVKRLEERGLLTSVPRKGTFVRAFSTKDIDDIYSFRAVVESFAIRQAMPRIGEAEIEQLESIVREMEAAARSSDEERLMTSDVEFHHRLCVFSNNKQTLHAFSNIQNELQVLIAMVEHRFETLAEMAADHWPIVNGIRSGDVESAVEAMNSHIQDAWQRISAEYGKRTD